MSAKRKRPRYVLDQGLPCDSELGMIDISHQDVVRLLNAGERAKAEVKRLKAELASLRATRRKQAELECTCDVAGHYEFCGLFRGGG